MKTRFALALILCLGLFLRLFSLKELRLTHDEMSIGYNAYSVLLTGKDEWGKTLPLVFRAFGEGKLPIYIYSTVPFVAALGLNAFSVKLPSLIAGLVSIYLIYSLIIKLTSKQNMGLVGALLMAINPWPLHLSRMALESNLALMFFLLGLIFWMNFTQESSSKKHFSKNLLLTGIFLTLTGYTYIAYRLMVPLMFFVIGVYGVLFGERISSIRLKKAYQAILLAIALILFQLPFVFTNSNTNTNRLSALFVQNETGSAAISTEKNNFCFLTTSWLAPVCRYVYSARIYSVQAIASSHLRFINPSFLFLDGDPLTYLGAPGYPELFVFFLPFYLIGFFVYVLLEKNRSPLILPAFFCAAIPSTLAGSPQIVRGSPLLPFVIFFTALGVDCAYQWLKKINSRQLAKGLMLGFLAVAGIYSLQFGIDYFLIYPKQYRANFYQLGQEQVAYLLNNQSVFERIYISNDFPDAHIALAFYGKIDPLFYQQNVVRPESDSFGFQHPIELGRFSFGQRLEDLATNQQYQNWLYVTGATQDVPASKLFLNYSGIHTEIKMVDVNREYLYRNDNAVK